MLLFFWGRFGVLGKGRAFLMERAWAIHIYTRNSILLAFLFSHGSLGWRGWLREERRKRGGVENTTFFFSSNYLSKVILCCLRLMHLLMVQLTCIPAFRLPRLVEGEEGAVVYSLL